MNSNVIQDCVSAMLPSHLKGIVNLNVLHCGETDCTDGTHTFNCSMLAGRYTLYLAHSQHVALWRNLRSKLVPSSTVSHDGNVVDYNGILGEDATAHILENIMVNTSMTAMDREMVTPFLKDSRVKYVMLHSLFIGDYESLLWVIGLKCVQYSGSPFFSNVCLSRIKHLQRVGGGIAVAVDLQSATIGKRSSGLTLMVSDYEDDVVGGFMRTTRYDFGFQRAQDRDDWMDRMVGMGARVEASYEDGWDSEVMGTHKRALERRLLLNMEVRKEVRHRREIQNDECGCGAGSECVLL